MFGNACVYNKKMNPRRCQEQSCGSHQGSSMTRPRQDHRDRFSHDPKSTTNPELRIEDPGHRTTARGSASTPDPGKDIDTKKRKYGGGWVNRNMRIHRHRQAHAGSKVPAGALVGNWGEVRRSDYGITLPGWYKPLCRPVSL